MLNVLHQSESSQLGTSDISTWSSEDGDYIPTPSPPAISRTSTVTLQRTATTSRTAPSQRLYNLPNDGIQNGTPPSLRWTHRPTPWRTSCPHCERPLPMNFSLGGPPSAPTLQRSNATVGNTPRTPPRRVSSYQGRFKTGWTKNLTKR